jgi:hypothetical protein
MNISENTREAIPVLENLRAGRDLLLREGWTRSHYAELVEVKSDGESICKRCAYGALEQWTIDGSGHYHIGVRANGDAQKYLKLGMEFVDPDATMTRILGGAADIGIADWNDRDYRTKAEVIAAFDKAIELAEAAGER